MTKKQMTLQARLMHWLEITSRRAESGKTIRQWCRENAVNEKTYYFWQRRLREIKCESSENKFQLEQSAVAAPYVELEPVSQPAKNVAVAAPYVELEPASQPAERVAGAPVFRAVKLMPASNSLRTVQTTPKPEKTPSFVGDARPLRIAQTTPYADAVTNAVGTSELNHLRIEIHGIRITAGCAYPTDNLAALLRALTL